MTEDERFGLVFTKTRVYKFGHGFQNNFQNRTRLSKKILDAQVTT
jgi:hypothetical protein